MQRNSSKAISFGLKKYTEFGLADAGGVRQQGLENWLKLARRRTDDLQHLRGRRLLL
jgi:hypothetical protein